MESQKLTNWLLLLILSLLVFNTLRGTEHVAFAKGLTIDDAVTSTPSRTARAFIHVISHSVGE